MTKKLKERIVVSLADVDPLWGHVLAAKVAGVPGVWGVELDLLRMVVPMYPSIGAMIGLGHGVMIRASIIDDPMRVARLCSEMFDAGASAVSIPSVTSELFTDDEDKEALEALRSLGGMSKWLHVEFEIGADRDEDEEDDDDDPILGQLPDGHTPGMRAVCVDADFALLAAARLRSEVETIRAQGIERAEFLVIAMCVRLPAEEVIERLAELWAEPSLEICAVLPEDREEAILVTDRLVEALKSLDREREQEAAAARKAAASKEVSDATTPDEALGVAANA